MEDNLLWQQACMGDQQAFGRLYDRYYSLLFAWGCKWSNNDRETVKDVLQDFFLYLWEKKEGLSRDIRLSTYLLTSFKRRLLVDIRRVKTEQYEPGINQPMADQSEEIAAFIKLYNKVLAALDKLSPAQREVIELRYLQGLSIEQIAERKKSSVRTVYNLSYRALSQLKDALGMGILLFLGIK